MEVNPDPDDMFVVIVGDNNSESVDTAAPSKTLKVDNILDTAVKLGEFVEMTVKVEPLDSLDLETEYNEETIMDTEVKVEQENLESEDETHSIKKVHDKDYIPKKQKVSRLRCKKNYSQSSSFYRRTLLKPSEYKPYVDEIRKMYPELQTDKDLLIETIAEMMRSVKVPEPPVDFCREDGLKRICKFCEAVTSTLAAAVRHYQEKHGPRYLVCYACGVDFKSTSNLYKHESRCRAPDASIVKKARERSTGSRVRTTPFIQFYNKQRKPFIYPCSECTAVFSSKSSLTSHENLHKGRRPYRCAQCSNAYTSQYAFSRHMKTHSNVEYICDYCGKSFKIKSLIVSHMHTHEKLKKFSCEYCERRFRQKVALNHHVNTVHKNLPPPCACQICGKRYPKMSLLKVHMNKVHGLLLMTREMFVKALPTMSEIQMQQAARVVLKSEVELMEKNKLEGTPI